MEHRIFVSTGDKLILCAAAESGTPVTTTLEVIGTSSKTDVPAGFSGNSIRLSYTSLRKFGFGRIVAPNPDCNYWEIILGEDNMKPSNRWFGEDLSTIAW